MHLLTGLVVAILALFPCSEDGVADLYHRWMERYEMHLIQQITANFERENAEKAYCEPKTEVSDEQTASEKLAAKPDTAGQEVVQEAQTTAVEAGGEVITVSEVAADTALENPEVAKVEAAPTLYQVDGEILDPSVQEYLYRRLCESGCGWFYEYALLIAYQESSFNILAVNPNQRDKGLYQYRVEYVPWMDWTNPYQQIDYFVQQMANRANMGLDMYEMISRHRQSDYGSYDAEYVADVLSHRIERIR